MLNLNFIYRAVFCCIILSVISCNAKDQGEESGIEKIDEFGIEQIGVAEALESSKPVNASFLGVESFEYIPLETNESTFRLFNPHKISTIDDDKLIVKWRKQMALFNQKTGKYISDVGQFGTAPNSHGLVSKSINDRANQGLVSAFARTWKEIFEYSISTGQIVNRINIQNVILDNDTLLFPTISRFYDVFIQDDEHIFGFLSNVYGDSPFRLVRYNDNGVLKKTYPQGQSLEERSNQNVSYHGEAIFYEYSGSVMFKERYSDTLFVVNDERLSPRYVFNLEEKSPPYQDKNKHLFPNKVSYLQVERTFPYVDRTQYIFIESLIEHDDFLIFSIMHMEKLSYGFFDKSKGTTYVSKLPDDPSNGFYNDIDDFIPFRPTFIDRENNKLVGFITAEDVLTWFDSNPELVSKLPEKLKGLSRIKPEDNPVVMIAQLKSH